MARPRLIAQRLTMALVLVSLALVCFASHLCAEPLPASVTMVEPGYADADDSGDLPLSAPTANAFPSEAPSLAPSPAQQESFGVAPQAVVVLTPLPAPDASQPSQDERRSTQKRRSSAPSASSSASTISSSASTQRQATAASQRIAPELRRSSQASRRSSAVSPRSSSAASRPTSTKAISSASSAPPPLSVQTAPSAWSEQPRTSDNTASVAPPLQFTSPINSSASATAASSSASRPVRRQFRTRPASSPSVSSAPAAKAAPKKSSSSVSPQTALSLRHPVAKSTSKPSADRQVRVLLYWGPGPVKVSSSGGGVLLNGQRYPTATVTVSTASVNGHWHLTPVAGHLCFKGLEYRGSLDVYPINGKLQVVNVLPLEEYLRGVVPKELMAREIEAMKAQAILARTYAVSTAAKANKDAYWELRDDTGHQVYGGASAEQPLSDEAVRQTKNQVLTYNKEFCVAVLYHSTCGGYTDSNANVFGTVPVPYLQPVTCGEDATAPQARNLGVPGSLNSNVSDAAHQFRYASGGTKAWCQGSSFARWEACWTPEELGQEVGRKTGKSTGSVVSVNVLERTVSGRVKRLEMRFSNGATEVLGGDTLRNTLCYRNASGAWCSLPSTRFEVVEVSKRVVRLRGSGWGHGIGMCQWGAKAMAQRGCQAKEILQHYYAGTEIVPLDSLNIGK